MKDIQTCCERRCDPMAIVTDSTVGIAMGIPPIRSTSKLLIPTRYGRRWTGYIIMISIIIPIAIEQMQKLPMAVRTCKTSQEQHEHSISASRYKIQGLGFFPIEIFTF